MNKPKLETVQQVHRMLSDWCCHEDFADFVRIHYTIDHLPCSRDALNKGDDFAILCTAVDSYFKEKDLLKFVSLNHPEKTVDEAFDEDLHTVVESIEKMLQAKNRKYGNSVLEPIRIFSKGTPLEQLNVRIDDKLNRIRNRQDDEDEDVIEDLIGYLVVYKIALLRNKKS